MATFTKGTTNLTGRGTPERLEGVRVSGNFFDTLGAHALWGRVLQPDDEGRKVRVVVLARQQSVEPPALLWRTQDWKPVRRAGGVNPARC